METTGDDLSGPWGLKQTVFWTLVQYGDYQFIKCRWITIAKRDSRTNALDHETNIAKIQEWLRPANIATTRMTVQPSRLILKKVQSGTTGV